ncbi:MAG: signal recognition particle protein, partial [Rhodosalinus sp.]
INSMTKKERANPQILQASRKKRIAAGAGLEVSELNKLLKQHRQMSDMMKKLGKKGGRGALRQALGMMGGGKGGAPGAGMDEKALQQAAQQLGGLGGKGGMQLPPGLSGFGRKK